MDGSSLGPVPIPDSHFDRDSDLAIETDNPALREIILAEIERQGRITFRRFMELVLYHPVEGYYSSARHRIGRSGDYITSPEVSPVFGYTLARQLAEIWHCLDRPERFTIVEHGAGNGRLAGDILRWTAAMEPPFHSAIEYRLVERSAALRAYLRESFGESIAGGRVTVPDDIDSVACAITAGCVLANELLDSFPVHRVRQHEGRLREIFVTARSGSLMEAEGEVSTPELTHYFARLGCMPGEGCEAEVNLAAPEWLARQAAGLRHGYMLIFDYGYVAERLYAPWRRTGTLLCFHRHEADDAPFAFLGRQDITSHIDFTTLCEAAEDRGLQVVGLTDQARFLTSLGLGPSQTPRSENRHAMSDHFAYRRAVETLLDPAGLGRIGVLLLAKNSPVRGLTGVAAIDR